MTTLVTAVARDDGEWERLVFAEVLIPNVPNVYNDYCTPEAVKNAAYLFMQKGFGIDIEHNEVDILDEKAYVVESFIARAGDPDFIEGAWVIGMQITDDLLWQDILDGKINGFSYQAIAGFLSATLTVEDDGVRIGITEPSVIDGHTHDFMVMVGIDNRPSSGGTSETNGHFHSITRHSLTAEAAGHTHRYNFVSGKEGK